MGIVRVAALAALLACVGCLEAEVDRCADGRVCPVGTRCLDEPPSCVLPDQLTECVGQPDFADCDVNGVANGTCYGEVCLPGGCNNGILDPGEVCDDGVSDEPTCSADCTSDLTCGNGIVDPTEECDGVEFCRPDCSQPRCGDDIHDEEFLEQCDRGPLNSDDANAPCRPNCVLPRCGDGAWDTAIGEACDDGNTDSGDRCSGDCRSDESCGNSIVDLAAGEQCDDGPTNGDGCSQTCRGEAPRWTERTWASPTAYYERAVAYDPIRRQLVAFGGSDATGDVYRDTWVRQDGAWTELTPPGSPAARAGHAMAFDGARLILFGGYSATGDTLGDTWGWNGRAWKLAITGANDPDPRWSHGMAYDSGRDRLVLFGGATEAGASNEVWEWTGFQWAEVTPLMGSPTPRSELAMSYDPTRGRVVMFGGFDTAHRNDVWEWTGTMWDDVTPTGGPQPAPRAGGVMAFDADRQQIVLYGGRDDATIFDDVWTWNGSLWTEITPASSPARAFAGLAYDLAQRELVMHGGSDFSQVFDQTWVLGETDWFDVTFDGVLPTTPLSGGAAYDAAHGRIVLFDGAQTWEWHGARWTRSPLVLATYLTGAAVGSDGDRVVYCGGRRFQFGEMTYYGACYAWDDSWAEIDVGDNFGPPRAAHAISHDGGDGTLLLFGGSDGSTLYGDTWRLDATGWTQVATTGPAPRTNHGMAYDPERDRVVLFGGQDSVGRFGDTWEWDGNEWADRTPKGGSPTPRNDAAMTYDARRHRILLHGGDDGGARDDTWEWDGTDWALVLPDDAPPARYGASIAYDAANGRTILFGGAEEVTAPRNDTWEFRYTRLDNIEEQCLSGVDADEDLAIGCADSDCAGHCARCGDGTCDVGLETFRLCPADCTVVPLCGDRFCDAGETMLACPGDCVP